MPPSPDPHARKQFRLLTLGGAALVDANGQNVLEQRRRFALLALLAVAGERGVTRDKLVRLLSPESTAAAARHSLHQLLYYLRQQIGDDAFIGTDPLHLNDTVITSDIADFERALSAGLPSDAVTLYHGPFLDGFHLGDSGEYEEWQAAEGSRLGGLYRDALFRSAGDAEARGDGATAVEWWRKLAHVDPLDGRGALGLVRALAAAGDRPGALAHARVHEALVLAEFGGEPDPELTACVTRIRAAVAEPQDRSATATGLAAVETKVDPPEPAPLLIAPAHPPTATGNARPGRARLVLSLVGVLAVALMGAVLIQRARSGAARSSTERSDAARGLSVIAVLPFENLGPADDEYFAAGMTDEITSRLGRVGGVGLVPRSAAQRYARTDMTMRELGRELGVDYLLLGSVRWGATTGGSRNARITVELLRADSERQLWSTTYDRAIDDIFEVQSDIADQVFRRLGVTLPQQGRSRVTTPPTENHEAYTLYLKGRYFWNKRTEANSRLALDFFQRAVDLDPGYALAWAGIADTWIFRGFYSHLAPREAFPRARSAAERALEFDPALAEAHASMAHIHFEFDHDWEAAEREYQQAIAYDPRYAVAHHWYGGFLSAMGRHQEALQQAEMARALDPLSPIIQTWVGLRYYFAGRYEEAIAEYQKALQLDPNFAPAHWHLGWAYEQTGRFEEAVAEAERAVALDEGNLLYVASLGHACARAGMEGRARETLARLARESAARHVSAYHVAVIHLALGDTSAGLDWLERAYEERSPWIGYLGVDPRVDSARAHPRFERLLEKTQLLSSATGERALLG